MSTHYATVIKIKKEPHPNAEKLVLQKLQAGNVLVLNDADWAEGELAVHIEPDYEVDTTHPAFNWLKPTREDEIWHRIQPVKLRGIQSFGLAVQTKFIEKEITEGDNVIDLLPIRRWTAPAMSDDGDQESTHSKLVLGAYDVESYIKFVQMFVTDENVVVTEKLHGESGRWAFIDGRFYAGSRTTWKKESASCAWWKALNNSPELKKFLQDNPDKVAYGEIYGKNPGYTYGCEKGQVKLALFDIRERSDLGWRWLNWDENVALIAKYNLPWVPILGIVPFNLEALKLISVGKTLMPAKNPDDIREGVVVKVPVERLWLATDRTQVKIVSTEYLATKQKDTKPTKERTATKPTFDVQGVKKIFDALERAVAWDICKKTLIENEGDIDKTLAALKG